MSNQDGTGSFDPMQADDPLATTDHKTTSDSPKSSEPSPSPSPPPSPKHYTVVSDGDVIFALDDNVSVRVSSVVLSLTSGYFRSEFSNNWSEGLLERSATHPVTLNLENVDPDATHRLFCLLHHQPDPEQSLSLSGVAKASLEAAIPTAARKLRDLAIVCDYFPCIEPLKMVFQSLLFDFATIRVKNLTSFQSTADLVTAAYLMELPHHFRLFTKRLVTEFSEDLADAEFPLQVHASSMIEKELQMQSDSAWAILNNVLPRLADGMCKASTVLMFTKPLSDPTFIQRMFQSSFPPGTDLPRNRDAGLSLSYILTGLYHADRMQRVLWCEKHQCHTHDTVGRDGVVDICLSVDKMTHGLCLRCTKLYTYGRRCTCIQSEDAEHESALKWVLGDSIGKLDVGKVVNFGSGQCI